jgi:hypothetical protein
MALLVVAYGVSINLVEVRSLAPHQQHARGAAALTRIHTQPRAKLHIQPHTKLHIQPHTH